MKLIGVYLSPYVRRVAAALISRGLPYEHQPVNGYKEYEAASRYNPVGKVPSLVLDDGEILIDSSAPETDTKRWRAQIHGGLRALDEAAREGGPLQAKPLDAAAITAVVAVELLALLHPYIELLPAFPALAALAAEQRDAAPFAQTRPTR